MWILGLVIVAVVVIGLLLWVRWRQQRGATPPELQPDDERPPEGRDATWDPRERYDE